MPPTPRLLWYMPAFQIPSSQSRFKIPGSKFQPVLRITVPDIHYSTVPAPTNANDNDNDMGKEKEATMHVTSYLAYIA
ncbi:hypothetical protein CLCR_11112 [Cladophialophora carrionii]|uniref:Uncharacterized protein n=1 Tax=Cladophialophora carrionii TaxID=86049 RepID=A0A1C1D003_9EURO|nr:hypothetical protein CLCR_11112 [Cladophialophora carrionii]